MRLELKAAGLALLLAAACHEATEETPSAPEMQKVNQPQAVEQQKVKQPPNIQLQANSVVCTKFTPPGPYADRPAECVEVSGSTSMSPGASATFTCRGWGRSSIQLNDWYEVSADRPRSWWSDDQSIVTVAATSFPNATVSAVAPGTANVNCTIDGILGSLQVTVTGTRTLVSMFVTPNPVGTFFPGEGRDVSTNFVDNYGQANKIHPPVDEWQSDNPNVATVGAPFQFGGQVAHVTAINSADPNTNGVANVKARVGTIWSSTSPVTVRPAPRPTTVTLAPTSATINKGASQTFTATVKDQYGVTMTGASVSWAITNPLIATIAATGPLTANATGTGGGSGQIQATAGSVTGSAGLTVLAPATVTVSPASASMCPTGTLPLSATVKDQNGTVWTGGTVAWSSSNTNIATVSSTGSRTANAAAVGNGSATITASIDVVGGQSTVTVGACLTPPSSCTIDYIPAPHYLKVAWVNGDASASTEVSVLRDGGSWQVVGTDAPGVTQHFYVVGPGLYYARVRHLKTGYPPSNYCNTGAKTVP